LLRRSGLRFADNDLLDFSILPKVVWTTKRGEQLRFIFYGRHKANHVDQVLLLDTDSGQVSPAGSFDFALLGLFSSGSQLLLVFVELIGLELLCRGYLILDGLLVVRSPAVRTGALLVCRLE
jgi:hypothetical protein